MHVMEWIPSVWMESWLIPIVRYIAWSASGTQNETFDFKTAKIAEIHDRLFNMQNAQACVRHTTYLHSPPLDSGWLTEVQKYQSILKYIILKTTQHSVFYAEKFAVVRELCHEVLSRTERRLSEKIQWPRKSLTGKLNHLFHAAKKWAARLLIKPLLSFRSCCFLGIQQNRTGQQQVWVDPWIV